MQCLIAFWLNTSINSINFIQLASPKTCSRTFFESDYCILYGDGYGAVYYNCDDEMTQILSDTVPSLLYKQFHCSETVVQRPPPIPSTSCLVFIYWSCVPKCPEDQKISPTFQICQIACNIRIWHFRTVRSFLSICNLHAATTFWAFFWAGK
jgi:hypothetical protein